MAFKEYEFDVARLWEPAANDEASPCVSKAPRKVKRKTLRKRAKRAKRLARKLFGGRVEDFCRRSMQAEAARLAREHPTTARAWIATALARCAACRRCIGL